MKMKRLNIFPLLFICIVSLLLFSIPCIAADLCRSADSCRCVLNNGSFIDLKPLGNKNNTPRFSGKPSQKNDNATFYFYNPCYSFPCNADNKSFPHTNVAACRIKGTYQQVIGLQNPKFWKTTTGAIALNYSVSTPSHSQNLLVFLECNKSATAPVLRVKECDPCQDNTSMNFTMTLHGKEVCLQISNEDSSSGLSTGSVLLLIFFISVQVYLIVGILYNICIVGAKGKEIIPNIALWQEMPSYIKDGCLFTSNCCRVNTNYNKL